MPVEGRWPHNNGLSEDTLSVLRDGGNNGNEIRKNNANLGNNAEARVYISVSDYEKPYAEKPHVRICEGLVS